MTILSLTEDACDELRIERPSSLVGSTQDHARQLLALLNRVGRHVFTTYNWPVLTRLHSFTTSNGTASYALPGDFHRFNFRSFWDDTNNWELIGPVTPQEWQTLKYGIGSSGARRRFRIKSATSKRFFIDPTPTSSDTLVFEYISTQWWLPKQWVTSTVYGANAYVSNEENIYKTSAGGTSGATAPTHTTGSASDGAVTWAFQALGSLTTFVADTDITVFPERLIGLGLQAFYLKNKGLEYAERMAEFELDLKNEFVAQKGARTLSLVPGSGLRLLNRDNLPDTGFGS